MSLSTTKMSSKGQVVIPENVRKHMGFVTGDQFVVVAENDVIILKVIKRPSMKALAPLIQKSRKQAKAAGLTKADLTEAVKKSRKK